MIAVFSQGLPVFYKHKRIGYKFKPFYLLKYRSMINVDKGCQITTKGDTRITGFGKIIRLLKIDEIPQLINIIRGEMQFIGPRPEVPEYVEKQKFSFLNSVKPGLTDFSSILFRNEEMILNT